MTYWLGFRAILTGLICIAGATTHAEPTHAKIKQGEYLATLGNCVSCHTKQGGALFAGGVAFNTNFGIIYSTNITPDRTSGIGAWSATEFRRAMREGVRANGEHLYPVFPYPSFAKLSDNDIDAIYGYLQTVPVAQSAAVENQLSFPFNQRWLLSAWKALYLDDSRFVANTEQSKEWNRGAYLVQSLGHCGACHTPRNFLGAERADSALMGGTYLDHVPGGQLRRWSAVNLTSAPSGLVAWSADDIVAYLKTGVNSFATSFGPMNEVIMNSTRHLHDTDARAIATYLKALPPGGEQAPDKPSPADLVAGEALYAVHCATCHLPNGQGATDTGPALFGNPVVQASDPASLINVILYGPELPELPSPLQRKHMEAYADTLSDQEVAQLTSYLRNAWGHHAGRVNSDQVAEQR